jgi:hypothetical protein
MLSLEGNFEECLIAVYVREFMVTSTNLNLVLYLISRVSLMIRILAVKRRQSAIARK